MVDIWSLIGYLTVSAFFGVFTGAACVVIGGVGGLSALARRIGLAEQRVEDVDSRITKEVKTRAAHAAVEARKEAGSAKEVAERWLGEKAGSSGGNAQQLRPSVLPQQR